jgi:hypothetical protein
MMTIPEAGAELASIFGRVWLIDNLLSMIANRPILDMNAFIDLMESKGYFSMETDGSLEDAICKHYGKKSLEIVKKYL